MKTKIKKYKQYELNQVQESLSAKNKKLIKDFLLFCGTTAGKSKLANIERVMVKIADTFECDMDKITLEQLRMFLNLLKTADLMPPTKNETKKHLKRFLKEVYPDWSKRFKGLEFKMDKEVNKEKINSETILNDKDVETLMRATTSIMNKALISLIYETASRPEEVLKLKWNDINLDKNSIKLNSGKTGETRELMIVTTHPHLKRLKTEYPYQDRNQDDFIFPSPQDRNKHISIITLDRIFRQLSEVAFNGERKVYPYLLRHSRLKIMQKKLPTTLYEKFSGHSIATANKSYNHMDTEDLREALMSSIYKIEELTETQQNELKKEIETLKKELSTIKTLLVPVIELQKRHPEKVKKLNKEVDDLLKL